MKYIIISFSLILIAGCTGDRRVNTGEKTETAVAEKIPEQQSKTEFTKYENVVQMLNESHDFSEEEGSLKVLSKGGKPLHIQVSKPILNGDQDKFIKDQTMRDIVYVAFQAFAQTDINELTISSVPMKAKGTYVEKYRLTLTVSRDKASRILNKYLKTEDYKSLFKLDGEIWIPSENFDALKFKNLDAVYSDLK